jgi:hypothetical protein
MNDDKVMRSFEAHGTRRGYCLAPAIEPTEERRYANRFTQELFDAWCAAISSMTAFGDGRVADLADRKMPPVLDAYKQKLPVRPKHIDDEA